RRAAARLPDDLREVYVMFALEGHSYIEVADRLGIPQEQGGGARAARARAAQAAAHRPARGAPTVSGPNEAGGGPGQRSEGRSDVSDACAEMGERIAPYVDGELDADEAEAFALHLAGCKLCRDGLHDALQLAALET